MTREKMENRGRMYDQEKEVKKGKRLELQKRAGKDYYFKKRDEWQSGEKIR